MSIKNVLACCLASVLACRTSPPNPPVDHDRPLTRAECTAGVDHAIGLFSGEREMTQAAEMMRTGRDGFIKQCLTTAKLRDHACLMQSKSSHELGLCPMPGTR